MRFIDNFPPLERKFIIAKRPKYLNETDEEYLFTKRIHKNYLVLQEYDDKVLCIQLGKNKETDSDWVKLDKSLYPFFKFFNNGLSFRDTFIFIDREAIYKVSDENVRNDDFRRAIYRLTSHAFSALSLEEKKLAKDYLAELYASTIKRGSVIILKNSKSNSYFVNEVLVDGFLELIPLSYDIKAGLTVNSLEMIYVPYNDIMVANVFYSEDNYLAIKSKIDEARLRLSQK